MIRITKMSDTYYGIELSDDYEEEMKQIKCLVNEGVPVIIIDSVDELKDLDIYEDVIMVNRED